MTQVPHRRAFPQFLYAQYTAKPASGGERKHFKMPSNSPATEPPLEISYTQLLSYNGKVRLLVI